MDWLYNLSTSDKAAWYAAIVSTLGLCWQVYNESRKGSKLIGKAFANMKLFMPSKKEINNNVRNINFQVFNIGDRTTTITHVAIAYFPSAWRYILNKPKHVFSIPSPSLPFNKRLPITLEPGTEWSGFAKEIDEYKKILHSGDSFVVVFFESNRQLRIKIPKVKKTSLGNEDNNKSQRIAA